MWFVVVVAAGCVFYWLWKASQKRPQRTRPRQPVSPRIDIRFEEPRRQIRNEAQARWVPPSEPVSIHGYAIPGGMLYLTAGALVHDGAWTDPSLIQPGLTVSKTLPVVEEGGLGYWPSYEEMSPSHRARYLSWLSGGRSDPGVDPGYVFVFFYGLEHRILRELMAANQWGEELDLIQEELRRLLGIYQRSSSFQGYCGSLVDFLDCFRAEVTRKRVPLPAATSRPYSFPLSLRVGLAQIAQAGEPIPPEWALAWAHAQLQANFKTAARRCHQEFDSLFKTRYAERFGDGMKVPADAPMMRVEYRPASSSLRGHEMHLSVSLPDVTSLKPPVTKLSALIDECTTALDEYSRALGRKSESGPGDLLVALLPRDLLAAGGHGRAAGLVPWLKDSTQGGSVLVCPAREVIARLTSAPPVTPSRKQLELLALLLEKLGYGVEPDVRLGARSYGSDSLVAVFPLPAGVSVKRSPRYAEAALLAGLAAVVAQSDGDSPEEWTAIKGQLRGLDAHEERRIDARLLLLRSDPPKLQGVRSTVADLTNAEKVGIAGALLAIAATDGRIGPEEVRTLARIYSLLGLESNQLHSDIHALAASPGGLADSCDRPVTVLAEVRSAQTYAVPIPVDLPVKTTVVLDPEKIRQKHEESEAAFELLAQVFGNEGQRGREPMADAESRPTAGIVEPLATLTKELLDSASMSGTDWEKLCSEHGVLAAGAIEEINAATLDAFGEALIFGADSLSIDPEVADQLRREYAQQDQN